MFKFNVYSINVMHASSFIVFNHNEHTFYRTCY